MMSGMRQIDVQDGADDPGGDAPGQIDVQDALQEGFEVAPMPPIGPDGAPQLAPLRRVVPPRPRLCEAGPCRNYHRFEIQVDAANPRATTVPIVLPEGTPGAHPVTGGTVYQPPPVFHVQTHHYCYPSPGVEMALGDLPVTTCNRWDPSVEYPRSSCQCPAAVHQEKFLASEAGRKHRDEVQRWEEARRAEQREALETEQLIQESLRVAHELPNYQETPDHEHRTTEDGPEAGHPGVPG
jgi:hypothetical protein